MGETAVPYLVDVLNTRKGWVRWEAAKALGQIPGAAATAALVSALEDKDFDIRWLAAEGLISCGRDAIVPLMQALLEKSDSEWFREGAHHVLFDLSHEGLGDLVKPVLDALEDVEPALVVPLKAKALLDVIVRR
jgi:HEAT repeat protein